MTSCGLCYAKNIVRGSLHKNFNSFIRQWSGKGINFRDIMLFDCDFFHSRLLLECLKIAGSPNKAVTKCDAGR